MFTSKNIYQEVFKQLLKYYEQGITDSKLLTLVVEDFNDYICADYDLVKLALQAQFDFSIYYNINIPSTMFGQMLEYDIDFSRGMF